MLISIAHGIKLHIWYGKMLYVTSSWLQYLIGNNSQAHNEIMQIILSGADIHYRIVFVFDGFLEDDGDTKAD